MNMLSSLQFLFFVTFLICILGVESSSVERSSYIVHVDESAMPKVYTTHHHWYSSIINSLASTRQPIDTLSYDHHSAEIIYVYDHVLHGFSAMLSQDELNTLKKMKGFVSAYMDRSVTLHTTHTFQFLSLNPGYGLWPASNYGDDIIIGVIDTGVWPENQSFNDHGMPFELPKKWRGTCEVGQEFNASLCNKKLIGARSFNKGWMAHNSNITPAMNSARDTDGHGTHTSTTVAGNYVKDVSFFGYAKGTARGIAPRARLAAYKVAGWNANRYSFNSDVLAGMDAALADISSFRAMEKGVFVSTSAGNAGPYPGSVQNSAPWVLTVAAGTIDRTFSGTITLGDGSIIIGWTIFPASALVENLPLIYNKTYSSCNSTQILTTAPNGIIICEDIGFAKVQLDSVTEAGLIGAIFIRNEIGPFEDMMGCPGVVINPKNAAILLNYAITNQKPSVSMKFQETTTDIKPAPKVALYSSRGPSTSCQHILKPDVMAPGTLVLSGWIPSIPVAKIGRNILLSNEYTLLTGTSMACPHASGIAALLKGAHPECSVAAIKSAMMTTANPLDNSFNPINDNGEDASPLAMGSGQVNPNKALDPGLIYDTTPQDYVNMLCSLHYTHQQIITITRSRNYDCSTSSYNLNYPSFIALYQKNVTRIVKLSYERTVTNVGEGTSTYIVEVVPPKGSFIEVSPTTLVFDKKYQKMSYRVTIRFHSDKDGSVSFGSIVWTDGHHSVRSPIVVSPAT